MTALRARALTLQDGRFLSVKARSSAAAQRAVGATSRSGVPRLRHGGRHRLPVCSDTRSEGSSAPGAAATPERGEAETSELPAFLNDLPEALRAKFVKHMARS